MRPMLAKSLHVSVHSVFAMLLSFSASADLASKIFVDRITNDSPEKKHFQIYTFCGGSGGNPDHPTPAIDVTLNGYETRTLARSVEVWAKGVTSCGPIRRSGIDEMSYFAAHIWNQAGSRQITPVKCGEAVPPSQVSYFWCHNTPHGHNGDDPTVVEKPFYEYTTGRLVVYENNDVDLLN